MAQTSKWTKKQSTAAYEKLAEVMSDMEHGLFEWPDGASPYTLSGRARVNKRLALTMAGFSDSYARSFGSKVFANPLYHTQYALVKKNRQGGVGHALALAQESTMAVSRIGEGLVNELARRVEETPEEIPTKDLLKYAHLYFRLGAELEGKLQKQTPDRLAIVLAAVDQRLPAGSRDAVSEAMRAFRAERGQQIEDLAAEGAGLDTIDAEWTEDEEPTGRDNEEQDAGETGQAAPILGG